MTAPWEPALVEAAARVLGVRFAVIPDRRRVLLEMARARAAELQHPSVASWVATLADPVRLKAEEQAFVQVATVGFTFFDRDRGQLDALAASLAKRARPVRVWSAGCSSGEEVWTLGIALSNLGVPFSIVGTDVDVARLEVAQRARYSEERLQRLPARERGTFFASRGAGILAVQPVLRKHASFQVHNLSDQPPPAGPFDAIVCRNVLMYFTNDASSRVLAGFGRVLAPGGRVLLAGHESPTSPAWVRSDDGALLAWGLAGARPVVRGTPHRKPPVARSASPARSRSPQRSVSPAPAVAAQRALKPPPAVPAPPTTAVERLVQRACAGLAEHRWAEALSDFSAALALHPSWPELHYLLGVVHRKTGDKEGSRRALKRALFLDDQFWPAAWMLSGLLDSPSDQAQHDRLRSGALSDASSRPVESLFRVAQGAAWAPTVEQLLTHPHARRWRT